MRARKLAVLGGAVTVATVCGVLFWPRVVVGARMVEMRFVPPKTVAERLAEYGPLVRERLAPNFAAAGIDWPPRSVLLVAFKAERRLEVFASNEVGSQGELGAAQDVRSSTQAGLRAPSAMRRLLVRPILAASGTVGPKLREGDRQVPEGLYAIESLNPMSRFHLALRVGYPNEIDRARASADGRADIGGDIMVHGSSVSIGCLAMGDEVAEDLFVLAGLAGVENVSILIAPCDLRVHTDLEPPSGAPAWTRELWDDIRARLATLPAE